MRKVLVLLENGFQDQEYIEPVTALQKSNVEPVVASHKRGVDLEGKHGAKTLSNLSYDEVNTDEYEALFIPGGGSPANVRKFPKAIEVARDFANAAKPIAAICHGPQVLVTAGLLKNKTITCWPKIADEIKAAGANYVDKEVVVDGNLITSRDPQDVRAFSEALIKAVS